MHERVLRLLLLGFICHHEDKRDTGLGCSLRIMHAGLHVARCGTADSTARRRLNKLGTFSLSQLGQSKSPFAEFMRSQRKSNENFEESLLKLVRTLPTVLKYLPSEKAQVCRLCSPPRCCVLQHMLLRPCGSMLVICLKTIEPPCACIAWCCNLQNIAGLCRTRAPLCRACSTGWAAMPPTWRACC